MNGKAWIANPLLAGLLVLALGVPCTFAADGKKSDDTSPEAKLPAAPPAEGSLKDNPCPPKPLAASTGHDMSPEARLLPDPPDPKSFKPDPCYEQPYDSAAELGIYRNDPNGRHMISRPRPPIEYGIRLYDYGAYTPRPTWLGAKDPIGFHFMSFGDFRVAGAYNDNGIAAPNGKTEQSTIAARLNLDMDMQLTATERIHAFVRPLDKRGSFTRYQIGGGVKHKFVHQLDFNIETLFFEGDIGAMRQGLTGHTNPTDLPFAVGRVPIVTQNGVWIEDAFDGGAFSITAKNSPAHDISNMDFTFFAGFNKVATAADPGGNPKVFGMAGFADLLRGYLEYGYGYLDASVSGHSYHNVTAAFSKRYRGRIANSVRLIGNFGQKGVSGVKTADGVLVLIENSLVPRRHFVWSTVNPLNFVPYFNAFIGFKSPQSLARGGDSGGVLRNTGITFESDGLTGYPTLDATAHDSYGGALGLEYLFTNLDRQIVFEVATVQRRGNSALGAEHAIGARYQHPFTPAWIIRLDAMKAWRPGRKDIFGVRLEFRRKF
jgi:hypothetical protein